MDNRNQPKDPRTRRDSIPADQQRRMQKGYPVRTDASRMNGYAANRPTGSKEVPATMRNGEIPVRENANAERTYPVLNRSGMDPRESIPDSALNGRPVKRKPLPPEFFEDDFLEVVKRSPKPVENPAENEPDSDQFLIVTRQRPVEEPVEEPIKEPVKTEQPETADEPIPAAETAAQTEAAPETPESPADEAAEETVSVPVCIPDDDAAENAAESAEDPLEQTQEFSIQPAAEPEEEPVPETDTAESTQEFSILAPLPDSTESAEAAPAESSAEPVPAEETPAPVTEDTPEETEKSPAEEEPPEEQDAPAPEADPSSDDTSTGEKKLWILPLAVAILVALAACIGIPAAMSARETIPDFDMTEQYGSLEPDDPAAQPSETGGVGREDILETEPSEAVPAKFNVTISFFDREPIYVSTSAITLADLLEKVNYTVLDSDRFSVSMDTMLTEESTITVDTVTYASATETITIPYETHVTNVQTIPKGQKNVLQYGKNGVKTITYQLEMVNGAEASRTVTKEEITTAPVDEQYQLGVGGTLVGNDGKTYSYSYYRLINATYYDLTGLTYLGYEADESVVAVDMDYIPLGTKIYVKNDQFDFGVRIAADTGSMIEGWEVDIWLGDDNPQKKDFAYIGYVKNMRIYYLE